MTPSLPLWVLFLGGRVVGPDFATPLAGRGYNKGKRPTLTAC